MLAKFDWYITPCHNPDGYEYSVELIWTFFMIFVQNYFQKVVWIKQIARGQIFRSVIIAFVGRYECPYTILRRKQDAGQFKQNLCTPVCNKIP